MISSFNHLLFFIYNWRSGIKLQKEGSNFLWWFTLGNHSKTGSTANIILLWEITRHKIVAYFKHWLIFELQSLFDQLTDCLSPTVFTRWESFDSHAAIRGWFSYNLELFQVCVCPSDREWNVWISWEQELWRGRSVV